MKTFHDIENALRDYNWMTKEINRLREELNIINNSVTAAYGIQASMPKANTISDSTSREVIQRERKHKALTKFEKKVNFIENRSLYITDDRELTILNCLLTGMSIVAISQHMGFSERKVYSIKDDIVKKMMENAEIAENAGIAR